MSSVGGMGNVMATYDDHDFGKDNADSSYAHRNATLQLFKKYFRMGIGEHTVDTDGTYTSKILRFEKDGRVLNVKVIVLDTRYHKAKASYDYLGADQWLWLESQLSDTKGRNDADVILLLSSIQVLPDDKFLEETWGYDMPLQRKKLLDLLLNTDKKVVLLSGDVHYAEISQALCTSTSDGGKKSLLEVTSSGISHTFTYTLDNTRQLIGGGENGKGGNWVGLMYDTYQSLLPLRYRQHKFKHHYKGLNVGVVDLQASKSDKDGFKMTLSILDHNGKVVMEHVEDVRKENGDHSSVKNGQVSYECVGIRGKLPAWRYALFLSVLVSIFPFYGHFLASMRILLTMVMAILCIGFIASIVGKKGNDQVRDMGDENKIKSGRRRRDIRRHRERNVLISRDPPKVRVVSPVNSWTKEEKIAVHGDYEMDEEEKKRVINAMKKMRSANDKDYLGGLDIGSCGNEVDPGVSFRRASPRLNRRT